MARILIAYQSTTGQTQHIVDVMVSEAETLGHQVTKLDVESYEEPLDMDRFDGFIIGGPIRQMRHAPSLANFVINHLDLLESHPSAFFSVSMSAAAEDPEARAGADEWAQHFMRDTHWHPDIFDTIGGALLYSKYSPILKQAMRGIAWLEKEPTDPSRDYEFTDWEGVRRFARDVLALADGGPKPTPETLLDEVMKFYDYSVVREQLIPAGRSETWDAMLSTDLTADTIVNALSELRALPERLKGMLTGQEEAQEPEEVTFGTLVGDEENSPFRVLSIREGQELVFGAVGKFWKPVIEWHSFDPEDFVELSDPGVAKLAISLRLEPADDGTRLHYEARTATTDEAAHRRFKIYWSVIGRFAGLVMGRALDLVADKVQKTRAAG